jgi:hypothetical protein
LDEALAKAQGEFLPVRRNREGPYGMFADLLAMENATRPALAKYCLATKQYFITHEDHSMNLITELAHKGQFTVSAIYIPFFNNPQHTHGYVTYMARLGYGRILTLAVDDADDGERLATGEEGASSDLVAVQEAVAQATNKARLDELWKKCMDLKLPAQSVEQLKPVFAARLAALTKKGKPDANAK